MPLYKEAPAPPRGPEPVFGPPPPAKIAIDESQDKLPQPLRMLTRLLEHAIITPVFDSLFGVSGIRETAPQPLCTQLQAQVHLFEISSVLLRVACVICIKGIARKIITENAFACVMLTVLLTCCRWCTALARSRQMRRPSPRLLMACGFLWPMQVV